MKIWYPDIPYVFDLNKSNNWSVKSKTSWTYAPEKIICSYNGYIFFVRGKNIITHHWLQLGALYYLEYQTKEIIFKNVFFLIVSHME